MATTDEVKKLAALARIEVADDELDAFARDFDAILGYAGQLETLTLASVEREKPLLRTVMRPDGEPHASGEYTDALAAQFPDRKGNALQVKQIISHD